MDYVVWRSVVEYLSLFDLCMLNRVSKNLHSITQIQILKTKNSPIYYKKDFLKEYMKFGSINGLLYFKNYRFTKRHFRCAAKYKNWTLLKGLLDLSDEERPFYDPKIMYECILPFIIESRYEPLFDVDKLMKDGKKLLIQNLHLLCKYNFFPGDSRNRIKEWLSTITNKMDAVFVRNLSKLEYMKYIYAHTDISDLIHKISYTDDYMKEIWKQIERFKRGERTEIGFPGRNITKELLRQNAPMEMIFEYWQNNPQKNKYRYTYWAAFYNHTEFFDYIWDKPQWRSFIEDHKYKIKDVQIVKTLCGFEFNMENFFTQKGTYRLFETKEKISNLIKYLYELNGVPTNIKIVENMINPRYNFHRKHTRLFYWAMEKGFPINAWDVFIVAFCTNQFKIMDYIFNHFNIDIDSCIDDAIQKKTKYVLMIDVYRRTIIWLKSKGYDCLKLQKYCKYDVNTLEEMK